MPRWTALSSATWITAKWYYSLRHTFPLAPRKPLSTPQICISSNFPWWYRPQVVPFSFHHLDCVFRIALVLPVLTTKRSSTRSPYVRSSFGFRKILSFVRSGLIFCLGCRWPGSRSLCFCSPPVDPLCCFRNCKDIELCFNNFTTCFPFLRMLCHQSMLNPRWILQSWYIFLNVTFYLLNISLNYMGSISLIIIII